MSDASASPSSPGNPPALPAQVSANADAVADQAQKLGKVDEVRSDLRDRLSEEVELNSKSRQRQFEQAVVWRRWNIALGLLAGLLTAAAGSTALFTHAAAAIVGLAATFATGSLATLNAGQRKVQSQTAACGYQENEASASELLQQLPFLELATAQRQVYQVTARRLQLNQTAEPPSSRALYRVDRSEREQAIYGRALTFSERNPMALWVTKPPVLSGHRQSTGANAIGDDPAS